MGPLKIKVQADVTFYVVTGSGRSLYLYLFGAFSARLISVIPSCFSVTRLYLTLPEASSRILAQSGCFIFISRFDRLFKIFFFERSESFYFYLNGSQKRLKNKRLTKR